MSKGNLAIILVVVYLVFRSIFVEPNSLAVTKYSIPCKELSGMRVAFLSDFHLKKRDYKRLNQIVKVTKNQNPNLVLIGGDFGREQDYGKNMDINLVASKLNLINAPIYAVLGEADWWSDGKRISQSLKSNGIHVLENSNRRVVVNRRYLDIIGIADLTTRQPNIEVAFSRTRIPRIVITHNPDIYYDIMDEVSLILAGHTHGGQFVIPFASALFVPSKYGSEFASGLITSNHNSMIVSRGIGTTGIPIRLNCKPEIVIVDFIN